MGPQLNDGELLLTFPDLAGNVSWIINGSPAVNGTPYGDAARAGGQRTSAGGMPGWAGTLSPEELAGVVYYERLTHGGLDAETAALELELLEAFVATGTGFGGDETPGDIGSLFSELGGGEQATG